LRREIETHRLPVPGVREEERLAHLEELELELSILIYQVKVELKRLFELYMF